MSPQENATKQTQAPHIGEFIKNTQTQILTNKIIGYNQIGRTIDWLVGLMHQQDWAKNKNDITAPWIFEIYNLCTNILRHAPINNNILHFEAAVESGKVFIGVRCDIDSSLDPIETKKKLIQVHTCEHTEEQHIVVHIKRRLAFWGLCFDLHPSNLADEQSSKSWNYILSSTDTIKNMQRVFDIGDLNTAPWIEPKAIFKSGAPIDHLPSATSIEGEEQDKTEAQNTKNSDNKNTEELKAALERTARALEAEKEKTIKLSERVIVAEKESNQAKPKINELESKLETTIKQIETLKKDIESLKIKIKQEEGEKTKATNALRQTQAQLATLQKRQAG